MLREEARPHFHVAVFHFREALVDVPLGGVGFRTGEDAVEIRGVGLVLPMVLEGVEVRRMGLVEAIEATGAFLGGAQGVS